MVALIKNVTNKYGPTWYVHASSGFIMYLVAVNVTSAVSKPFQWDWPDQYIHFEQQMLEDLCRRVCDLVWLEVLNCLSFTGNCAKFLKCCDCCLELLLGFLIPPHMRWKRKVAVLERLAAILFVAKTLVWFHANLHCRVAKSMWPLLTVNVQMALIGDTHYALELVAWYREIFSTYLDRGFCLYLWFARSFQYIGIARLHRTGSEHVGPVQRLFEHLVLCRRQHAPHARFLRYKLARRMPLWKTLWFPVHCGEEPMIRAAESLLIQSFRPNANFVPAAPKHCGVKFPRRRKRPPKFIRLRQKGLTPGVPSVGSIWSGVVWKNMLARAERLLWGRQRQQQHDGYAFLWSMSFHEAFRFQQKIFWVAFGQFGPVNLYERGQRRLVALWLSCKSCRLDLCRLRRAWACDSVGVVLDGLCKNIDAPGRRRLAFAAVRQILRLEGLPSKALYTMTVPEKYLVGVVRGLTFSMARNCKKWSTSVCTWVLKKTRVVVCRRRTFRDDLSHAQFARKADVRSALDFDDATLAAGLSGFNMKKVEAHIDTAKRRTVHEICHDIVGLLNNWSCWSGLGRCKCPTAKAQRELFSSRAYTLAASRLDMSHVEFTTYTHDMRCDDSLVRVPDDKDRACMWLIPPACYVAMLLMYAILAPTWKQCPLSVQEANVITALTLLRIVPEGLHRWLQLDADIMWLPYVYVTVKSKCYGGTGRVCRKLWHSCCRKVISYCRWPARRNWRFVGRGLDVILRASGKGFEVRDMSCASTNLLADIHGLQPGQCCNTCQRCGHFKRDLNGVVCDAGQFFEMVKPHDALASVREIMHDVSARTGQNTVTVLKTRKVHGFLGGTAGLFRPKSVTFCFDDLLQCFWASVMVCFCYVGNMVFRLSGLPIGGLLSRVASGYVLACDESAWTSSVSSQRQSGFFIPGVRWTNLLVCRRYIDDLLILSRAWCYDCLCALPAFIYKVPFDPGPNSRTLTWLDMEINLDTICLGLKSTPFRIPPPWDVTQQRLRNLFWARLSRYQQLQLTEIVWQEDLCFQMVCLLRQHVGRRRLRNLVFSMYKSSVHEEIAFMKTVVCAQMFKDMSRDICGNGAALTQ